MGLEDFGRGGWPAARDWQTLCESLPSAARSLCVVMVTILSPRIYWHYLCLHKLRVI